MELLAGDATVNHNPIWRKVGFMDRTHCTSLSIDFILDLAARLAQPVAVCVNALLAGLAVLPDLVAFRYPEQA